MDNIEGGRRAYRRGERNLRTLRIVLATDKRIAINDSGSSGTRAHVFRVKVTRYRSVAANNEAARRDSRQSIENVRGRGAVLYILILTPFAGNEFPCLRRLQRIRLRGQLSSAASPALVPRDYHRARETPWPDVVARRER